jgi:hypothetical protein
MTLGLELRPGPLMYPWEIPVGGITSGLLPVTKGKLLRKLSPFARPNSASSRRRSDIRSVNVNMEWSSPLSPWNIEHAATAAVEQKSSQQTADSRLSTRRVFYRRTLLLSSSRQSKQHRMAGGRRAELLSHHAFSEVPPPLAPNPGRHRIC